MTWRQGDLIWLDFTPQSGREQRGRRPAVVVSNAAYNAVSSTIVVCPITTADGPWEWKHRLSDGLAVAGYVLTDQVRSVDPAARHADVSVGRVPSEEMADILARVASVFDRAGEA